MIAFFTRHATAANLLMGVILVAGLIGVASAKRQLLPEYDSAFVQARVVYTGASPEQIEEAICQPIEDAIDGIDGITEIRATAWENVALVKIEVTEGHDVDKVVKDVRRAVERIDTFPEAAEEPVVWQLDVPEPVISVSIAAEMPDKDLLALAETIKDELADLDDVSIVHVKGAFEHEIRIEVDREKLAAHRLTFDEVVRQIKAAHLDQPAGSVETDQREIKLRMLDVRRRAQDYRDFLLITPTDHVEVPLHAVAGVHDTFEEDWHQVQVNGKRAITLLVSKADDEDSIRVSAAVREYLDQRRATLPRGVELYGWADWSVVVRDRLGMLLRNFGQGLVLVFLTMWLLLNFRLSFWVAAGIPVAVMGTIFGLHQFGYTLDMITLFSLIMALGIVVDDAIVIGENIYARFSRGEDAMQAAVQGTKEVAVGVISSMVTTVAVMLPLMMLTGEIGKVIRVIPAVVIFVLAVSIIEAFLVLPCHLGHSLRRGSTRPNRVRAAINAAVEAVIQRGYRPALAWCLQHRLIALAGALMLLLMAAGLMLGRRVKYAPIVEPDGDILEARLVLPQDTDLERTKQVVRRITAALREVNEQFKPRQPPGQDLVQLTAATFGENLEADERGSHVATVTAELLKSDVRQGHCDDIVALWREKVGEIPGVVSLTIGQMKPPLGGISLEFWLSGNEVEPLRQASRELRHRLAGFAGVSNLRDNLRLGKREIRVRLKPAARSYGLTNEIVAAQLHNAFSGSEPVQFQRGGDAFTVNVRLAKADRRSPGDLDHFLLTTPAGGKVPFVDVAHLETARDYSSITRVDGRRTVMIAGDMNERLGSSTQLTTRLQQEILPELREKHPSVSVRIEGQQKDNAEAVGGMIRGFLIGMSLIYVALAFVFKSYLQPFVVMAAVPFGIIGAIFLHYLLGAEWTAFSNFGFIALAGIVVNDSIVLVEFIKNRRREGKPLPAALLEAGCQRFRPVFLTSATTAMGLLPMLLERSLQAQILIPLVVSIIGGIISATVLVLLLVPCLYSLLGGRDFNDGCPAVQAGHSDLPSNSSIARRMSSETGCGALDS